MPHALLLIRLPPTGSRTLNITPAPRAVKVTESNDDFPGFEIQAVAYDDI